MCRVYVIVLAALAHVGGAIARTPPQAPPCDAPAQLESGLVCGTWRSAVDGCEYASFRGVPYARQPEGELRFKELQPAEKWDILYALEEGPNCPQDDIFYGRLMTNQKQSEACIYANIHVPRHALPSSNVPRFRDPYPPYPATHGEQKLLPILVFIHGGGFAFGSGDADLHGPERLVSEGVIVVTFNYRLNVFGFLSLNSTSIPGNNGLRDMITLLKWVRDNARAFGGDPDDVTLAGQSAGACAAHMLSLSPAAKGLFKRVIMMSGTAIPRFYTTLPAYSQYIAGAFLTSLGINSTDPDEIHSQLVAMPLEKIMEANKNLQFLTGLIVFLPVIETPRPGVTTILDEDTEVLIANGKGKEVPLLVGYTSVECESFRPRFEQIDILTRLVANPLLVLSPTLTFTLPPDVALDMAKKVDQRYFNGTPTMDKYVKVCTETFFEQPTLKLAQYRSASGGAPMYLYHFEYNPDYSVIREALGAEYKGSGHIDDLTFVFQVNSVRVPQSFNDEQMWRWMTKVVTNFIRCSDPTSEEDIAWPPVSRKHIVYQKIESYDHQQSTTISPAQQELLQFFDSLYESKSS